MAADSSSAELEQAAAEGGWTIQREMAALAALNRAETERKSSLPGGAADDCAVSEAAVNTTAPQRADASHHDSAAGLGLQPVLPPGEPIPVTAAGSNTQLHFEGSADRLFYRVEARRAVSGLGFAIMTCMTNPIYIASDNPAESRFN
ncbi:hypothetical protein ACFPYJ_19640 [Paenibacillus solisilvae]|uniref:WIAG-tail domain n=1 Tax=Paenibacillus solisilvae TaxID=2486751 RepID=A0ABW0W4H9_9BACL